MKKQIKKYFLDSWTEYCISRARKNEIKKFKDPRRIKICSEAELTEIEKQQVDDLFEKNYGEKISYIWHQHPKSFTGKFDVNYFPELLYIPEFERFMNIKGEYPKVLADKNFLPIIADRAGVKMPKIIITKTEGLYRNDAYQLLTDEEVFEKLKNIGEVFVKPSVNSSSGRNCFVANLINGIDKNSNKPITSMLSELGDNFIMQEKIQCHESIKKLYPNSVNTFRIMTYLWNGEIQTAPIIMRIGKGGSILDNAHAGGIFIAVNNDGSLHEKAFTEFKEIYTEHPDTKTEFEGYKFDFMESIILSVKKMHTMIPQIGVINWDFTIDQVGDPVLIEANINAGSIWLFQIAHGKGVFGDQTAEILRWIRFMKTLPASERINYRYGKIKE